MPPGGDRKSVVEGKSVDLGGRRIIKKQMSRSNVLGPSDDPAKRPAKHASFSASISFTSPLRFACFFVVCDVNVPHWYFFFFSSRRRHTRYWRDWSSDVCSSDLTALLDLAGEHARLEFRRRRAV